MITFSKIGQKGNLGNQFFQIAATIGLAVENNIDFGFLPWQYQSYFKNKLPILASVPDDIVLLTEQNYHHHQWDFTSKEKNYDFEGWFQTEKYFDIATTKHYFEFEDNLVVRIKEKYADAFRKKTILISIRRGDFVNHPDYLQLSIKYYLNALVRFFPDWESRNLIVLSDDIAYCKFHFSFLENAFFGDQLSAIEQVCLGSLCDDFIISNSTFSWWSAWLGEKKNSMIIRPHKNFDGQKSLDCDDKDYYPERWVSYNASSERILLEKVVFKFNFEKNQAALQDYLALFFEAEIQFDSESKENAKMKYCFQKDYFLPPLAIYYSYLKKIKTPNSTIINQVSKAIKVSYALNYKEFSVQKDFGMFSTIFPSKTRNPREDAKLIYIENDLSTDENLSNTIVITSMAGQFCKTGYSYSLKRAVKKVEILLKKTIKKLLFIDKK